VAATGDYVAWGGERGEISSKMKRGDTKGANRLLEGAKSKKFQRKFRYSEEKGTRVKEDPRTL